MSLVKVELMVNGKQIVREIEPRMLLADFLREELDLTGTHLGCEHGVCGTCTVKMGDRAIRSCLTLVVQADGKDIETVESLANEDGTLHPLQQAFSDNHALQCGFCTPGFLMTLTADLERTPEPSDEEIRDMISGNLCRCTGYANIVKAVRQFVDQKAAAQENEAVEVKS
ncbi:(2Fe-2S)-binding protein [Bacillus sp. B15-48]|uniref:(2Fe-2S)-binding protein n=1 Tax=Bacillus sp. B15-48 TaxID=1548601 RepID=UPI00193ECAA8|nr:(2Fe-2S)-binding protein [Bacillus sp. B15-48]MBM4763654.1 2Fe-2S iron-sulfur cluster binding domain-containing protein [Bacillus sp. B15-48]